MKKYIHSDFFSKKLSSAEVFLLLMLGIFGILALALLPISAGYDEETHFIRVWQMSNLDLLPNQVEKAEIPFPTIYWDLSYRRQELVRAIEPGYWNKYGNLSIDSLDYTYGVETRSVYSPFLLLPQAIVTRYAGRSFGLPALPVFYLTRLAGLLSYLLLTWAAIRLAPFGKWIIVILAVSPMSLLQAITISADTISNGIAFLFIAGVLAIAQKDKFGRKEWWGIVFLSFLLFTAKVNLVFLILLPFFLISPARFKTKNSYYLLIGTILVLFSFEVIGWSLVAYPRLGTAPEGTNPVGQVKFIFTHLLFFIKTIATDIISYAEERFKNWVALYGYNYWPVPKITYLSYVFALFTALFSKTKDEREGLTQKERKIFLILFVVGYVFTIVLMYLSFTPVGSPEVRGVQGRYFTVVMPLLFLSLVGIKSFNPKLSKWLQWGTILLGTVSLASFTHGLWLSYHVPCGSQYYQPGLCYQPNYKNFSPESNYSEPLSNDLKLTQEIAPECDGMAAARVWVNTEKSSPESQTDFSINEIKGIVLVNETLYNSELPTSGWHTLLFSPDWESSQKKYLISIQTNDKVQENGIQVAYSIRPEYPQGKLFENSEATEQDLIFQYGCIVWWKKNR